MPALSAPRSFTFSQGPGSTIGPWTTHVAAGENLQTAINNASLGDVIALEAGATFTANFTKPDKGGGNKYITITTDNLANLPPPSVRATSGYWAAMPKLKASGANNGNVISFDPSAHHFRFVGIEICKDDNTTNGYGHQLIMTGYDSGGFQVTTVAALPHHIIFDRCYIHGQPLGDYRRGLVLNTGAIEVINCWFDDFHGVGIEAQALGGWNGTGPFFIDNNTIIGSTENILMGGATPGIIGLVHADMTFINNHVWKPFSWRLGDPGYIGKEYVIKNLFEFKNQKRAYVGHNLFENSWAHGQNFGVAFTGLNDNGDATWVKVEDVIFENNIFRHMNAVFNISAQNGYARADFSDARVSGPNKNCTDVIANGTTTLESATWNIGAFAVGQVLTLSGGSGGLVSTTRTILSIVNYGWPGNGTSAGGKVIVSATVPTGTGITCAWPNAIPEFQANQGNSLNAPGRNLTIRNNLMYDIAKAYGNNSHSGKMWQLGNGFMDNIIIEHNTHDGDGDSIMAIENFANPEGTAFRPYRNFIHRNNMCSGGFEHLGLNSSGAGRAKAALDIYMSLGYVWDKNVVAASVYDTYPTTTYKPTITDYHSYFENYATGDFRLKSDSPYKNLGTDGTDIGVNDWSTIMSAGGRP